MSSRAALLAALAAVAGCAAGTDVDRAVSLFNDASRPYPERIAALEKLGSAPERNGIYPRIRESLRAELFRLNALTLTDLEERAIVEALDWFGDARDADARIQMELHLDRTVVAKKRLSDDILVAMALNLAKYEGSASAERTLWSALGDAGEHPVVRAAALKALVDFHPDDLADRVLELAPAEGDAWLRDLQRGFR